MGGNYSGPARIDRMMSYLRTESLAALQSGNSNVAMDIDIIGFSRGAAEARDFANRVVANSTQDKVDKSVYWYGYKDQSGNSQCQKVDFRFMGLWDTVLSTNYSGISYQLGIPAQFKYVAQAVALNEFRSGNVPGYGQRAPLPYSQQWGGFPLESIGASSSAPGATRVELGFIGAHADIGGGFADNELSKVALAWMIGQASTAGVKMDQTPITMSSSAVLHDKSNNIQTGQPVETCALCTGGEDRTVNGAVSGNTQRNMGFGKNSNSMAYADTQDPKNNFITYQDRSTLPRYNKDDLSDQIGRGFLDKIKTSATGSVNVESYVAWLKLNGYSLDNLKVQ
jgi:hypothetical protein